MEKTMSIEEKIDFIKSLNIGDYFYYSYIMNGNKYGYLSIFKGFEELSNLIRINEFVVTLYETPTFADDEVDNLYYKTKTSFWKNDNTMGQINFLRKATEAEKKHFNRLLKEDGNWFSNGKIIKL